MHIDRLVMTYGNVEDFVEEPILVPQRPPSVLLGPNKPPPPSASDSGKFRALKNYDPAEFRRMLVDIHVAGLNRAKADNNMDVDLLVRIAVIKFLRSELPGPFNTVLHRYLTRPKHLNGPRPLHPPHTLELRERFARLQMYN